MNKSIGVVIPTYLSKQHLSACLTPLINSPLHPRILVIDSSSNDGTVAVARSLGVEVVVIEKREFNHGLTREFGRRYLATDIVVMLTPDAYPMNTELLTKLTAPLCRGEATCSYARQVPHEGANFFEAFPRHFNYPAKGQLRQLEDAKTYGSYTCFFSDSCAAYLNAALDEVGGFPQVNFGEDTLVAAKLLRRGYTIAYVAEAIVRHSHSYTLKEELKRNFEIGKLRQTHRHLLDFGKGASSRGLSYFKSLGKQLWRESPLKLPYAFLQTAVKYLGYCSGRASSFLVKSLG